MSTHAPSGPEPGPVTGWAPRVSYNAAAANEQRRRVARAAGGTEVRSLPSRCRATVCGVLRSVTLQPHDHSYSLEAQLCDGTDSVTLVWLGRTHVPGIEPGRALRVDGTFSDRDGSRVVYNPGYQLLPTES